MSELNIGDVVEDFNATAVIPGEDGDTRVADLRLSEVCAQAENGVVLYFYPKAGTPGCTGQACDFRDSLGSLAASGYTVSGISPDTPQALEGFAAKHGLNFTLISDADRTLAKKLGAFGDKMSFGRKLTGVIRRSTIVVDCEQRVTWVRYGVRAKGHVTMLKRELGIG